MKKSTNKPSMKALTATLFPDCTAREVRDLTNYLYSMTGRSEDHYKTFSIRKKNGKLRAIEQPDEALAAIQKRIYKYILKDAAVSASAAAYVKGVSIRDATKPHIAQPVLLKLDIRSFFESIRFSAVRTAFFSLGFDTYQAITLANLCCYKGRLPQGTTTSPMLSNLVMKEFDETVEQFCTERGIRYTRYSDDMLFSGDFDAGEVIAFVRARLKENGFSLHDGKTKVIRPGQRQLALGVVLNEKQQASKAYRRKIRQEIHFCEKYSVKSHLEHINDARFILPNGEPDVLGYCENLRGRINFALQINPDDAEMLACRKTLDSWADDLAAIERAEQSRLLEVLYRLYRMALAEDMTSEEMYLHLIESGFRKRQLERTGISEYNLFSYCNTVHLAKDDKGNVLSLLIAHGDDVLDRVLINPYCDGFFGRRFDKSFGCLIITTDKIAAATQGITNLVSFNNAPSRFFLSDAKRAMLKEYGNRVLLADSNGLETVRRCLLEAGIEVI